MSYDHELKCTMHKARIEQLRARNKALTDVSGDGNSLVSQSALYTECAVNNKEIENLQRIIDAGPPPPPPPVTGSPSRTTSAPTNAAPNATTYSGQCGHGVPLGQHCVKCAKNNTNVLDDAEPRDSTFVAPGAMDQSILDDDEPPF